MRRVRLLRTQPTQIIMGTKNISLPEDTYERLKQEKREGESFGDVVDRLMRRKPLEEFRGAWDDETAESARELVDEGREKADEKIEELYG